jgi:hypothetical protein
MGASWYDLCTKHETTTPNSGPLMPRSNSTASPQPWWIGSNKADHMLLATPLPTTNKRDACTRTYTHIASPCINTLLHTHICLHMSTRVINMHVVRGCCKVVTNDTLHSPMKRSRSANWGGNRRGPRVLCPQHWPKHCPLCERCNMAHTRVTRRLGRWTLPEACDANCCG